MGCKVTSHQTLRMIWRRRGLNPSRLADWGRGRLADFFLRPPTLTVSSFAALWPKDFKFSAKKDLNLLKRYTKNQKAGSILKVDFALSKWPHLHRKCANERFILLSIVHAVWNDIRNLYHSYWYWLKWENILIFDSSWKESMYFSEKIPYPLAF